MGSINGVNAPRLTYLSFDMWNQLRNDQRLNAEEAGDVVKRIVSSLLAAHSLNP